MIDHVAASTAVAVVAIAATFAMKRQRAAWRYAILLAAVLRFALPTAWLVSLASRYSPRVAPGLSLPDPFAAVLLHPGAALTPAAATHSPATLWGAIWAAGALACFALWARRALRPLASLRPPTLEEQQAFPGAPLRIVAAGHMPGAHGIWWQSIVLPDGLAEHLNASELRALVAHERGHIRRRDNLWAAIVHAIVSAFWFDPVLWWIERRMLAERELACDELALAGGAEPEHYVSGIAKVCCMSVAGPSGYAGATGANLHQRMEHIMSVTVPANSSRLARVLAGALLAVATLLPAGGAFLRAQSAVGPPDPDFDAGVRMINAKNYDGAYEAFSRSNRNHPSTLRGLRGMVEVDVAQGRIDDAMALLHEALAKDPGNRQLRQSAANVLVRSGRYDDAIQMLQTLIQPSEPVSVQADAWLRLGETYRRKGENAAAIAALQTARQLAPSNATAADTLALVFEATGRKAEAMALYRETLQLEPTSGIAANNLAYLIAESGGSLDEARELATRARQLIPNTIEASDTLGWIELKRKNYDAAVRAFAGIVAKSPATAEFRAHLAMALDQRGDTSSDALELKALLRAEPTSENQTRVQALIARL